VLNLFSIGFQKDIVSCFNRHLFTQNKRLIEVKIIEGSLKELSEAIAIGLLLLENHRESYFHD
jgi:hypothetical protein